MLKMKNFLERERRKLFVWRGLDRDILGAWDMSCQDEMVYSTYLN